MIQELSLSLEELFEEIVEQGQQDGVYTEAGYHDLVDETIEDQRRMQEFDADQDTDSLATQLKERWSEYQTRLTK